MPPAWLWMSGGHPYLLMGGGELPRPGERMEAWGAPPASDQLLLQNPPNDGTLTQGKRLGIDVGPQAGFDIAGAENTGYLATTTRRGTWLYRVDVTNGKTRWLGRIGGGRRMVVTGLAAWQN